MSTDNFWWIQCTTLLFFSYVLSKHAHVESCHYLVFDPILPEKLEEKTITYIHLEGYWGTISLNLQVFEY